MTVPHALPSDNRIGDRMDRQPVTRLHGLAMLICALGMMLDTLEMSFGGVLATVLSAPPAPVPAGELALLLAAVFLGAVIGAPVLGWWADRHGRRTALVSLLLWIAAASVGAAHVARRRGAHAVPLPRAAWHWAATRPSSSPT